jgi:hypothetical protein
MDYYLYLREILINNFNVSIKAIKIKNFIIKNYYLLFIFRFFPFYFFKLLINFLNKVKFNIQYVYMIDNIYFSNNNVFSINPYLLEFELDSNNDNNNLNLINKLKQYDLNVPFWFFKYNENLDECSNFRIKYMIKGKIIDTYKSMKDYDNEKLSSIFN